MNIKRFISVLLCVCFFAPTRAYADGDQTVPTISQPAGEKDPGNVLTVVKKDNLVPFTGILLSPRAVAELLAKQALAQKEAELAAARATELQMIRDQAAIRGVQVELDAEKKSGGERLSIRDNRISQLEKDLVASESNKSSPLTWFLIGAGSTAVVVAVLSTVLLVGNNK